MRCHTLEESEGVADPVGGSRGELRRVEKRVDGDDLLDKGGHDAEGVPQDQGKLRDLLALLAELEEGLLARVLVEEIGNVLHGATVVLRHVGVLGATILMDGVQGVGVVGSCRDAIVVSLLGSGGGSGGGSLLGVLVVALRMHPGGRLLRIMVLPIHGVIRHHLGCVFCRAPRRRARSRV